MDKTCYIQAKTNKFWRATLALSLGSFLVFSNLHIAQPLLPLFSKHFSVSPAISSLTVSAVTLTLSFFLIVFGLISDAMGRKKVMSLGLLISSILSIVIFFAPNFTMILLLRTLQGVFLASLPAVAFAYIGEEFEKNTIGLVIGIYISGNSIGGMGGRIISGFIADHLGWNYSFLTMGIIGLFIFLLFIFLLPACQNFKPKKFSGTNALKELIVHWKNPILRHAYYIAASLFFIFVGLFNYLGYYLHNEPYSLSTSFIGLLYISYIAGTFSSTLSGRLENRYSSSQRIILGLFIMLIGVCFMLLTSLLIILIGLTILVFGFFFAHSAASSWVSQHAQQSKASASALYLFSYYVGGSMGSFLLGYIWEPFGWSAVIYAIIVVIFFGLYTAMKMKRIEERMQLHINENPSFY